MRGVRPVIKYLCVKERERETICQSLNEQHYYKRNEGRGKKIIDRLTGC